MMDQSAIELTLGHLKEQVDRIAGAVLGDPSDPNKPGHGVRLDRVEQRGKLLSKAAVGVYSVCVAIVVSMVIGHFIG
jgi:hypothetical protein